MLIGSSLVCCFWYVTILCVPFHKIIWHLKVAVGDQLVCKCMILTNFSHFLRRYFCVQTPPEKLLMGLSFCFIQLYLLSATYNIQVKAITLTYQEKKCPPKKWLVNSVRCSQSPSQWHTQPFNIQLWSDMVIYINSAKEISWNNQSCSATEANN